MDDRTKDKLDESLLEGVTGGVVFDATGISGADMSRPYEVLDDKNGAVLGRFTTMADARTAAGFISQNHVELNWDQVLELRGEK